MGYRKSLDMESPNDNLFELTNRLIERSKDTIKECKEILSLELKIPFEDVIWTTYQRKYYVSELPGHAPVYIGTTNEPPKAGSSKGMSHMLFSTFEFYPIN